jgi:hypothetical protein
MLHSLPKDRSETQKERSVELYCNKLTFIVEELYLAFAVVSDPLSRNMMQAFIFEIFRVIEW